MIAVLLVLASSPLDPLWSMVDEERYESAIEGALQIAAEPKRESALRQKALVLGLTAACSGRASRCDELAQKVTDWLPLWRPDSRAMPALVQAVGRARLTRSGRHSALPKGTLTSERWCGPSAASEVLLVHTQSGVQSQRRIADVCIALKDAKRGFLLAYDRRLKPVAVLGSIDAPVQLQAAPSAQNRPLTLGIAAAGIVVAGVITYLLVADPGNGTLELTIERRP